ncbi:hypothetical protein M3I53_25435 [Paraburkholderia sp. CNPSo 3272]|uniref:hypothetical protein n=1 Tax=Paraburkholderia sp. CNPSo 3272 TaxID=2940931 RepID=UPI0020B7C4EC|nr:hypothetical protein [Paraburkholderia sp. CNPSo 3272]MCP3726431.1 hypothetical protein [Paraburkholderia sp. CNPSo 3272]
MGVLTIDSGVAQPASAAASDAHSNTRGRPFKRVARHALENEDSDGLNGMTEEQVQK